MKLLASEAYRWFNCPGSLSLSKGLDEKFKISFYDDRKNAGKIAHEISENLIKEYLKNKRSRSIDKIISKYKDIEKSSDDYYKIKNAVSLYVPYIKKLYKEHIKKGDTIQYIEIKNRLFTDEHKILEPGHECVAQADAMFISTDKKNSKKMHISIVDLKTGDYDYSESAYCQLKFTAFFLPFLSLPIFDEAEINFIVAQPNYWDNNYHFVKKTEHFYKEGLIHHFNMLLKDVAFGNLWEGAHCSFCPAVAVCPIMKQLAIIPVTNDVNIEKDFNSYRSFFEKIYLKKKHIENYLKNIEAIILKDMQAGGTYHYLELGMSYGHRKWKNEEEVKEKLSYLKDEMFDIKLKSPAQIEKIAGKENVKDLYYTPEFMKLQERKSEFDKIEE